MTFGFGTYFSLQVLKSVERVSFRLEKLSLSERNHKKLKKKKLKPMGRKHGKKQEFDKKQTKCDRLFSN